MKYKSEFEYAKALILEVGKFLSIQLNKSIDEEFGKDIKLALDKESEKKILDALTSQYNYPILSEESGEIGTIGDNITYWIIDPIDGTMNYLKNCPFACVSIAFWNGKEPIFGLVYDFYRKELITGYVGEGAWINDLMIDPPPKIDVSKAVLSTGFPVYLEMSDVVLTNYIEQVKRYKKIRMFGSAALSICFVALRRVDAYAENSIKLWDIAGGLAIISALGIPYDIEFLESYKTNLKLGVF